MTRTALSNLIGRVRRLDLGRDWVLIIYGAMIGTLTALGTVAFAKALHWTESQCYQQQRSWSIWLLPLLPMVGALVTGILVQAFSKDAEGHGVPQVIDAIARRGGKISWKVGVTKVLASIATLGTGGSAGAEGPIVQIGSTAGSVFGQLTRANRVDLSTLVGCGAAAGIASIFNAPITGVFFALEILLRDFSLKTFTPIVVASVFSTAVTQVLMGNDDAIFAVQLTGYEFTLGEMPSYVLLGLVCAVVSVGFTRLLLYSEDLFPRLRVPHVFMPIVGAALLGATGIMWIFIMRGYGADQRVPPFFGNGQLVPRDVEGRSFPAVRRFHLDQPRAAIGRVAGDVVARSIAVLFRDPADLARQVIPSRGLQRGMLVRKHTFLAGTAEGAIALVPACHVELPRDVQHLVELLRRRLVGERGRRTDPDLRRLVHAVRGPHAWQPAEPVRM